jgi:hypothetical protein
LFFSITSWASRTSVRWISEADISRSLSSTGDDPAWSFELMADLGKEAAFYALVSAQTRSPESP